MRNPTGKRVQALCQQSQRWKMIWGLTGTLRPSSAEDMFMPAKVITRAKLWGKSFYKWQKQYFYPTDYNGRYLGAVSGGARISSMPTSRR